MKSTNNANYHSHAVNCPKPTHLPSATQPPYHHQPLLCSSAIHTTAASCYYIKYAIDDLWKHRLEQWLLDHYFFKSIWRLVIKSAEFCVQNSTIINCPHIQWPSVILRKCFYIKWQAVTGNFKSRIKQYWICTSLLPRGCFIPYHTISMISYLHSWTLSSDFLYTKDNKIKSLQSTLQIMLTFQTSKWTECKKQKVSKWSCHQQCKSHY